MMEQRSRRRFLGALGAAGVVGGVGVVAGTLAGGDDAVTVLSAGSLATTFEDHVGPAFAAETGTDVHGEYYGSNAVMRMVEDRTGRPDVVASADATLLRDRLYGPFTDWDVEFATDALVVAYDDRTSLGRRLDDGEPWYRVLLDASEGDLALSDPDLDPLGYRAVQAFELAGRTHGVERLRDRLLDVAYLEPEEPQLLAGVESGARAAAVVYRNMAVDHGVPFRAFPPEYSFGDPSMADRYAGVAYTTDGGYTARGRPVVYSATVLEDATEPAAGRRLVEFLADREGLLSDAGLVVGEGVPRANGDVPEGVDV